MIKIKRLTKRYASGVTSLENVDFEVQKNEFVYLVGPSGAGKSTLLKMIFRADVPTEGEIFIDNFSLKEITQRQIPYLRRSIGVVFQDFKLLPNRTVFENVAFALQFLEMSRSKIRRQVSQVLELVGLQEKKDQLPGELSGGEQQRICIARAIVNNPPILLADEPTGSLDPDTSWDIMQLLSKINTRDTTVLVATHNRGIVDDIRKRVVALENGRIVRDQDYGAYYS
ncbi:cell division ATP-binding protein FtsE [Candidatus Marinamargulisbacteria bacterium SCGC AAA071-K20]|nr:cell division ATP-binding protein FtsE [Candidatus Marinamargulisbacteria bacterium SCGC AAA071-K20]